MVEWILHCSREETMIAGLEYLWMIFFVMIVSGIAKEHNLFMPLYSYIKDSFQNNRLVLFLTSALGGILPIEGRVTVSAGVLDTLASKKCGCGRQKMGIVDYLSTHHYYLWSPLEKTVILPMAAMGLTYGAWLGIIWPLLLVTSLFIVHYVFCRVNEEDIQIDFTPFKMSAIMRNVMPFFAAIGTYAWLGGDKHIFAIFGTLALYYVFLTQTWDLKKLRSYIKWDVLVTVAIVIVAGNYFKSQSNQITEMIRSHGSSLAVTSLLSFVASFFMGSSGKFIALAVLTSSIFGPQYFLWFFAIDYAGYLLSPTHKCVAVGNKYFGTPLKDYYKVLGVWCLLLIVTASVFTFML